MYLLFMFSFLLSYFYSSIFEIIEINSTLYANLPHKLYLQRFLADKLKIKESNNQQEELSALLKSNKLVAFRSGNVESGFFIKNYTRWVPLWLKPRMDLAMRRNAGFYYAKSDRRAEVISWWVNHYKEIYTNAVICAVYDCTNLQNEAYLWATFQLPGKFYNYDILPRVLLENSEGKKILYIGGNTNSIRLGYERGLQSLWKFPVSNFTMYYLSVPQTTEGCVPPHETMIETTAYLLQEIGEKYSDFDTAIFWVRSIRGSINEYYAEKIPSSKFSLSGVALF